MDVSSPPHCQMAPAHPEALCGGCPPPGSAMQASSFWPAQPSGAGFPAWPGQPAPTQPAPCWSGQPSTPCWPGTQTLQPVTVPAPAPMTVPLPAQTMTPLPAPAATTTSSMVPAVAPAVAPALAPALAPAGTGAGCQPCWPGPQYQPPQPPAPAPMQTPVPVPVPVPAPAPAPAPAPGINPHLPGWPAHPGWPYNPGQSGWPGQNPSMIPPRWLPPTSGPLSVPYNLNLARGMYDKMMMTILGHVKPDAKMFTVNFLRGNDIAFHINPRFNEGGKQVLVRNHKVGERWGAEERDLKGAFPFALGSPFEMKIMCTHESFRVAVNNLPQFEFRHRVRELNQIDRINILHDVVLTYVNVETLP